MDTLDADQQVAFRYSKEIQKFGLQMLAELMANQDAKGDALAWNPGYSDAIQEMKHHAEKLTDAMLASDAGKIAEHSADLANMAMLISRRFGVPEAVPKPPPINVEKFLKSALGFALARYSEHEGDGAAAMLLVSALVTIQLRGTLDKADYSGDNFRVVVTTKRKK